jgi:hypothetical protein
MGRWERGSPACAQVVASLRRPAEHDPGMVV